MTKTIHVETVEQAFAAIRAESKPAVSRQCGGCTLCCKLLPVPPLGKKAGERCKHQRHGKGCAVYRRKGFPMECALWSCRWLTGVDTADLSRPDRSYYVIDVMPDYITLQNDTERHAIQVVQIWCDPKHPDAHRDPALRAYLLRRGAQGIAAIVRYGTALEAITLIPPNMAPDDQWHELSSKVCNVATEHQHSLTDMLQALGGGHIQKEIKDAAGTGQVRRSVHDGAGGGQG